jgi:hypothetical protein
MKNNFSMIDCVVFFACKFYRFLSQVEKTVFVVTLSIHEIVPEPGL